MTISAQHGLPARIDLGIFLLRGDALEPFEPRAHPTAWTQRYSRRDRRWIARHGTRGRRGAGRVPAGVSRPADQLPPAWRVPDSRPIPAPQEFGPPYDGEDIEAYIARISRRAADIEEWKRRSWPLTTDVDLRAASRRTLRREEFATELATNIRCACSDACAIRGRHVIRFVATVYTDDLAHARRLVDRLADPRILDLLAITNNA